MVNRLFLPVLLTVCTLAVHAQGTFQAGYIVDRNNTKTECIIRDDDWYYNPDKIHCKVPGERHLRTVKTEELSEFVAGPIRFVRRTVKLDVSGADPTKPELEQEPRWEERSLLLRVLVEGKGTLYQYRASELERYFYSIDTNSLQPLIYKVFMHNNQPVPNNEFRLQLKNIACSPLSTEQLKRLEYQQKPLQQFFRDYNTCSGSEMVDRERHYKPSLHVAFRPGIGAARFEYVVPQFVSYQSASGATWRFGLEAEYVLPFDRNKWSIILEPAWQQFYSSKEYTINYKAFEIPLGLRYSFFLNTVSRITLDAGLVYCNSKQLIVTGPAFSDQRTKTYALGAFAGAGFEYDRIGIELRNYFRQHIETGIPLFQQNYYYQKTNVILSIRLF